MLPRAAIITHEPMKPTPLLFTLSLASLLACDPGPFAITKTYFCDDVSRDECVVPMPEDGAYAFSAPESKRGSWHDLGYYMYFHARQTPGLRVEWNQPLSPEDTARLETSLRCHYTLRRGDREVSGELEGTRVDQNGRGLWCFDYLGTMLIKFHEKYKSVEDAPAADFFPVTLQLRYESHLPILNGENSTPITVDWTR